MSDLWKKLRSENIGGSDIACLFGVGRKSYYRLWHEKSGNIEADDLDEIERVQAGVYMEPAIISWANKKWGASYEKPHLYVLHKDVKGMGCTPDAFDKKEMWMAQIKNVDSLQFSIKWEKEKDDITEAPIDILLQVQHEIECCRHLGFEVNQLIACVGGNRLYRMTNYPDGEVGAMICEAVEDFWKMDSEPQPDYRQDGNLIKEIRKKLPATDIIDMTGNAYIEELIQEHQQAKYRMNVAKDTFEATQNKLFHLTGNSAVMKCGDMEIKFQKRRGTPDKIITADMVGKVIKGRADSTYTTITNIGELPL